MKPCTHETRVRGGKPEREMCADCGVLLSLTDPVVLGIVDSAPDSFAMQQWIAGQIGRLR